MDREGDEERRGKERGVISQGEEKGGVLEEETGRRACRPCTLTGGMLDGGGWFVGSLVGIWGFKGARGRGARE